MIELENVTDFTGRFSVLETLELIRSCQYLITMDTSPVHLAASSDINIIGIFTIISPDFRLPYRLDKRTGIVSQRYKTWVVPNKESCAYCAHKTFEVAPVNTCFLNSYACMPTVNDIIEVWQQAVKSG
jgi:ADP-heptose:LPS heptosyltransferase